MSKDEHDPSADGDSPSTSEKVGSEKVGSASSASDEKQVWTEKGSRGRKSQREPKARPSSGDSGGRSSKGDAADSGAKSNVVRRRSDENTAVRKVAKAAETAGQRDIPLKSRLGYPSIVGLVIVLGLALVVYAKLTREAEAKPVQNRDHWHAVYGLWDCTLGTEGQYAPAFQDQNDPLGIHSHADGVIHIHPFFDSSDGPDAKMGVFLDAVGADMSDDSFTTDTGAVLQAGTECADGSIAVPHIRWWDFDFQVDTQDPMFITENFRDIQFDDDRRVYIFAFAALDADIPKPPQDRFETLNASSGPVTSARPDDSQPQVDFEVDLDDGGDGGDGG